MSRCQKKASGLYGAREDNRGRHTDHPAGRYSVWINQRPSIIILPIFMPDALPASTLPLYPGLGQAPNILACILNGVPGIPSFLTTTTVLIIKSSEITCTCSTCDPLVIVRKINIYSLDAFISEQWAARNLG